MADRKVKEGIHVNDQITSINQPSTEEIMEEVLCSSGNREWFCCMPERTDWIFLRTSN